MWNVFTNISYQHVVNNFNSLAWPVKDRYKLDLQQIFLGKILPINEKNINTFTHYVAKCKLFYAVTDY